MTQKPLKMGKFKNSNNYRRITKSSRFGWTSKICTLLSRIIKWYLYQNIKKKYPNIPVFARVDCRSHWKSTEHLSPNNSFGSYTRSCFWRLLFLVWRLLHPKLHFWKWKIWTYPTLLGEGSNNSHSWSRRRGVLGKSN